MDKVSILGFITLIILFVSMLFSFFLLTVETKNQVGNRLLAAYFIVFSIHFSAFFYTQYIELPLVVEMLRDQLIWLLSPLLFLYLLSSIYSDFRLRYIHLFHLIPFFLEILLFTPKFYSVSENDRVGFSENFNGQMEVKISVIYGAVISIFYLILMFNELRKYRKLLEENYSSTSSFNYKWLNQLVLLITFIFIFSQFKQLYKFTGSDADTLNIMRLILILLLLGFLSWIVLKSMYRPELFKAIDTGHLLVRTLVVEEANQAKVNNKTETIIQLRIKELREFMELKEPFLDSFLTIQKLASQFNVPPRELSILINHHLNQHFFDFVTEYRIKKAISLLGDPSNKKMTILEILYDVGFNSKTPFNKAFKKHTGLTPTVYRSTL